MTGTSPRVRTRAGAGRRASATSTRSLRSGCYGCWRASFRSIAEWLQQQYSFERHLHVPHVVRPTDRRWFLATLYSGQSNHLAGSRALIDKVLESELDNCEVALPDEAR